MCTTVIDTNGDWLHSPRELAAIGIIITKEDDLFGDMDEEWMDDCLCGVDVEQALKRAGRQYVDDGTGFLELKSG